MSLKQMVVFCCGFLLLSLTQASFEHKRICDIGLVIPKQLHTGESGTMERNGNINNRSLSVWNWIPHHGANTIPGVIFEAKCQSHHCAYPNRPYHAELNSVPIYSNMLVLTQDQRNRKCFTVKFQRVAVGCTCVWAKSSP
ncbi:interleukin 17a/f2 [Clarias gariepinus]|uniref:interleukin 17a/f2 n=1 Tax=Clarias gariepinus TaxID=13013 RepID=UPI00234DB400|nr:interleukin 17a/f2 [Clarias gariepinus]